MKKKIIKHFNKHETYGLVSSSGTSEHSGYDLVVKYLLKVGSIQASILYTCSNQTWLAGKSLIQFDVSFLALNLHLVRGYSSYSSHVLFPEGNAI